jgi:flagellar biosynthesis/type III secretory pathway M-ring protein FliF/YscJ
MFSRGPNQLEVLLILLPLFLILPVVFIALFAVSLRAKRREAEELKALSAEAKEE